MKKMKCYLIFLSLMACKKTPSVLSVDCKTPSKDLAICKELILGKWEWVRTEKRIDTIADYTPQNYGNHRFVLNFKTEGLVESYVDGAYKDTARYEIYDGSQFSKFDSGKTFFTISTYDRVFKNEGRFYLSSKIAPIKICDDSLFLPYENLFSHSGNDFFKRVK
jgi:hypothetical protein